MSKKDKMKNFFTKGKGKDWIKKLHGDDEEARVTAMRAALRRCKTIDEAQIEPAFYRLWHPLKNEGLKLSKKNAAIFAIACAELKEVSNQKLVDAMSNMEGDRAAISGLRFRKLLRSEDEDFLKQIRRIIRQVQNVNVVDLANVIFYWNDSTKKRLAEQYYKNAKKSEQ